MKITEAFLHELAHNLPGSLQGLIEVKHEVDLALYSSMKLAARASVVEVKSEAALIHVHQQLLTNKFPYLVIGFGSNLIMKTDHERVLLKLNFPFDRTQFNQLQPEYDLPASVSIGSMTQAAIRHGLKGWEVFTGIPASLGGAIWMNAGTELGEIGTLIRKVKVLRAGGAIEYLGEKESFKSSEYAHYFKYRKNLFLNDGDIILQATVSHHGVDLKISSLIKEYLNKRARTQPLDKATCGCVFKNYSPDLRAGKCIDLLNLKGWEYKGMRISPVHANFIENIENGSSADFQIFVRMILSELKLNFGVDFELEVIV